MVMLRLRKTVRLALVDDETISGVLLRRPRPWRACWVLGDAKLLGASIEGRDVQMAGVVEVDRRRVRWAQRELAA